MIESFVRQHSKVNQNGFTLLELSIVILIIAIITAMAALSGLGVIATARLNATNQKLIAIDQALLAFRIAHDRIPCPADLTIGSGDTNYGIEGASTNANGFGVGTCTSGTPAANYSTVTYSGTATAVAEGAIPTTTLGIPSDFMYDGWGNHIRYAVDVSMTLPGSFSNVPAGAVCGGITVMTGPAYPAATYVSNNSTGSAGAIYALISHGPNGHGAYTANGVIMNASSSNTDELTNCNCNSSGIHNNSYSPIYVQEQPTTQDTTNPFKNFDDIVTYKERWQMQVPWDKPGTACPAIYVGDYGHSLIQKLDINGNFLLNFSAGAVWGITSYIPDGSIWAVDQTNNRVSKYTNSGTAITSFGGGTVNYFGGTGYANGLFKNPSSLAFDSSGNLWVTDSGNNRVQEFTTGGLWLQSIPNGCANSASPTCPASTSNGQFNTPEGIAFTTDGNFWVGDSVNNRIQEFSSSGTWIKTIPSNCTAACSASSSNGQFNNPNALSIDAAGNLWVQDTVAGSFQSMRLQEFDKNGVYLNSFSIYQSNGHDFDFDGDGNIWMAFTIIGAGNPYRIGKLTPGGTFIEGSGNSVSYSGELGLYISSR